ncbi:MAG: DEAD/DEAH box helicase, partial [Desulfamplus sp.]|nr:DEAD/DEAH box helicase [Desulfamplus sp.]
MDKNIIIGKTVVSTVHKNKGSGTVIGFSGFDDELVDVIYENGEKIVCRVEDIQLVSDPISNMKNGNLSTPQAFFCRLLSSILQGHLTERSLISSVNFKIKPLPHQLLAVDFVMNRFKPRCLIADEVGLGKTIEAILVYQEYKLRGLAKRTLIVVPSGLVLQWHEELVSKFNEHFIIYNTDYVRTLKQSYGAHTNVWKLNDKIIVSIDTIKPYKIHKKILPEREIQRREWHNRHMFNDILKAGFDIVIIDEAHKLSKKGDQSESQRFKLGKQLSQVVPVFILLSATPHQGDEDLFFHLLQLIDPVMFSHRNRLTPELVREVCVRNKKQAVVDFNGKRIFKHRLTSTRNISRTAPENDEELQLYDLVTHYASDCYNIAIQQNNRLMIMLVMLYQRIASSSSFAIERSMKRRKAFLLSLLEETSSDPDGPDSTMSHSQEREEQQQKNIMQHQGVIVQHQGVIVQHQEVIVPQEDIVIDDQEIDDLLKQRVAISRSDIEDEIKTVNECIEVANRVTSAYKDKKLKVMIDLIEEIKTTEESPDLKFIIFTEFRPTQEAIMDYLEKFGYSCAYINGSLSREGKNEQVNLFRNEREILVSTDAGGEGINLQFCHCLINFDLPWNPSRLEQRIGRIDRIGQEHDALIFNFRLTDTIEDRVREILERKLELIKEQFGEDKYADVLDLLEDEFSFEQMYVKAIHIKEEENRELDRHAAQLFERAQEILDQGDLMIPFTETDEKAAAKLINSSNHLIKQMIFSFLDAKKIPVNEYKADDNVYYFQNPFGGKEFRNIVFDPEISFESEKYELLNIEHPLLRQINEYVKKNDDFGMVSAIQFDINKFSEISGYWFLFLLTVTNNIDKNYTTILSIFMEDDDFCNTRIGTYLQKGMVEPYRIVQNYKCQDNIELIRDSALIHAKEKAKSIFLATKLEWVKEIEKYEEKAGHYFAHREKLISQIKVDNIRESRHK